MKLTAHNDPSGFSALRAEWNDLLRQSPADMIFTTWEWQYNWWMAYQPGELWLVECRADDGRLLGIAPWFIETNREGERVVRGIGCVDVTDYVDMIVHCDYVEPVLRCFAQHLASSGDRYDRVNLCNLRAISPTYTHFPAFLQANGFEVQCLQQEVCPVIQLPATWDDYLSQHLSKKDRHELRRKLRRANAAGEVASYTVTASHDLDHELALFLDLMADSAPYKAEFLSDGKNRDFFMRIMPVLLACGWLRLHFLTINGDPAAAYLNFDYNRRVLVYNSGLRQRHGQHSPGIVLMAQNIRDAIEQGYEVYDFLRGNEEYKYDMGGKDTPIYMLKARLSSRD